MGLDLLYLLHRPGCAGLVGAEAFPGHLVHRQGVQGNVRARPGIGGRGEIVGIGFPGDLEHHDAGRLGHLGAAGEPLGLGPGLHDRAGIVVAAAGELFHVVEGVEHQQGVFELDRCEFAEGVISQQ